MPCVSIIIPIYNAEKFLIRCIESVQSLQFRDFELLLVDDGSSDNSLKICNKFASSDCRLRVFHKANGGVSSARNMGLEKATGRWITFIDSDDYVSKDYFPQFLKTYEGDIVFSQIPDAIELGRLSVSDPKEFISAALGNPAQYGPWAKFFRRDIITRNNIRFTEGITFGEDLIFNLQYYKYVMNLCISNKGFYYYEAPKAGAIWYKYRVTFESLQNYSSVLLESYYNLGIRSVNLERSIFYTIIVFSNILEITQDDNNKKKELLRSSQIEELARRTSRRFRLLWFIYISNKYFPYLIDVLVTKAYLRKLHLIK